MATLPNLSVVVGYEAVNARWHDFIRSTLGETNTILIQTWRRWLQDHLDRLQVDLTPGGRIPVTHSILQWGSPDFVYPVPPAALIKQEYLSSLIVQMGASGAGSIIEEMRRTQPGGVELPVESPPLAPLLPEGQDPSCRPMGPVGRWILSLVS